MEKPEMYRRLHVLRNNAQIQKNLGMNVDYNSGMIAAYDKAIKMVTNTALLPIEPNFEKGGVVVEFKRNN